MKYWEAVADKLSADKPSAELVAGGYAPSDACESAMQLSLEEGANTVIASSADGRTGVGLVEVDRVGNTGGPCPANKS